MNATDDPFAPFAPFDSLMRSEGLGEVAIGTFAHHFAQLRAGERGLIPEASISPVRSVPALEELPASLEERGREALRRTVVVRLNGGLGTTMGLDGPKSLLQVKEGLSFLEIIARSSARMGVPLLLMNSFATRSASLSALGLRASGGGGQEAASVASPLPPDFLQHKVPKVVRADLSPATCTADPTLAWCPPGHGDLYPSLVSSGLLERLLAAGYEYAFVSNADNLGAALDKKILGHVASRGVPFLMEVAERREMDRKGGHLALSASGDLLLRERAQCPDEDLEAFEDLERHRYFNTNNLWLRLSALSEALDAGGGILPLPLIVNAKSLDPRDPASTPVFQLETAMGAAISVFSGAEALKVPRRRFLPVKTTGDLLAVRSDAYVLTDDYRVVLSPERAGGAPVVSLDPAFFGRIDQLEERFPHGPPSLIQCERLEVRGDVHFGKDVRVQGAVTLVAAPGERLLMEDGSSLHG